MDHLREKGPNAYIIKFPVRAIGNVTLALKCMANFKKLCGLQLHDGYMYSDSQCVRSSVYRTFQTSRVSKS